MGQILKAGSIGQYMARKKSAAGHLEEAHHTLTYRYYKISHIHNFCFQFHGFCHSIYFVFISQKYFFVFILFSVHVCVVINPVIISQLGFLPLTALFCFWVFFFKHTKSWHLVLSLPQLGHEWARN